MLEFLDFIKGFDLHHIISMIAVFWFMSKRLEGKISNLEQRINQVEQRINQLDQKMIAFDVRMAVMESKISDVGTNVNHMMWHNQSLYHREAKEE